MIPSVSITRLDGQTGVVRPANDGILVIIGPATTGTVNQPTPMTRPDLAASTFGYGDLPEAASYHLAVAKTPCVLIRGTGSTAGVLGTVAHVGAGTSVVTATGTPNADYDIVARIVTAGTIATAGITLQVSLDGGVNYGGTIALGTANTYAVPNTGVTLNFAAGTVLAGQTESVTATGPRLTSADLTAALEALRLFAGSYEAILVVGMAATATEVAALDTWLSSREGEGKYRIAMVNSAVRTAAQTEAQYLTAMTTAFAASSSIRCLVAADQCQIVGMRGNLAKSAAALPIAARAMGSDVSRDPAYVADGPCAGVLIADQRGNPLFHDEAVYPGLDDIRLSTLRSFTSRQGTYVNNALMLSPSGSDYVYIQHARVMNKACEAVFQVLTNRLSQAIPRDPATGFIREDVALEIEGLVQDELNRSFVAPGRVSAAVFSLSRNDVITSNAGATLTGSLAIVPLSYVKKFGVNARFARTITANA